MTAKEQIRKTAGAQRGEARRTEGRGLALRAGIHLLLGAVLAGAAIPEECAPFSVALVGAAGCGVCAAAALVGACFGYLCLLGLSQGLRHAAACVLVFAVDYAFYDVPLLRRSWVMPAVTGAVCAFTRAVVSAPVDWGGRQAALLVLEGLLAGGGVLGYRWVLRPARPGRQRAGWLLLAATLCMALHGVSWGRALSPGGTLALLLAVSIGWKGGAGAGAVAGMALGLGLDLTGEGTAVYAALCSLCAAAAGLCRGKKRWQAAACAAGAGAALGLWLAQRGMIPSAAGETLAACAGFAALPEGALGWLERWVVFEQPAAQSRGEQLVRQKLEQTARAFATLSQSLQAAFRAPQNDNDVAGVFDRAAGQVCRGCRLQDLCWTREYNTTFAAMNDATPAMVSRRRCLPEDFPGHFADRCLHLPEFVQAVNEQYTALLYRRQYQSYVREHRTAVCRQYDQLAQLLSGAAAELGEELTPDPVLTQRLDRYLARGKLKVRGRVLRDGRGLVRVEAEGADCAGLGREEGVRELGELLHLPLRLEQQQGDRLSLLQEEPLMAVAGVAARRKDGETLSGDAGTYFKRWDGKLYLLLCDGMGSGEAANRESTLAVRLLEQFIRAGVSSRQALQTLACALALRGEACGGFTTVDLLQVDLFTGESLLLKMGAAPTFLRQGGQVRCLTGKRLPAGLEEEGKADEFAFTLAPGDCVLMVSDGVCPPGEEERLGEKLARFDRGSPKELARELLVGAPSPGEDDRTALVVRLARRS